MKSAPFAYARAHSVEEACAMLESDEDAKIVAGGQSLVPMMNLRLAYPSRLVDVSAIPGLSGIESGSDGTLRIGALVTHAQVEHSSTVAEVAPGLQEAVQHIAHPQIRSRGTIGGSLCHADAAAEWPVLLLAYGGSVTVQDRSATRVILADDLFQGVFATALRPTELLTRVDLPAGRRLAFREIERRMGDYGLALVAATCDDIEGPLQNVRIAVGGAVGVTVRASAAEAAVEGKRGDPAVASEAAEAAVRELRIIGDANGSLAYRRHIVHGLVEQVVLTLGAAQ
ncbi:MAG: xanthine dehydrogenase family protein subunit M [Actinobacteria bacterium]|nr:xanthine dehydrogenase family protein subunit M [Actinomycetota bacterium]